MISSELKVPISTGVLPLVAAHIRELARHASLPPERIAALERSVREAATNIIRYAHEPGAAETFRLRTELTPSMITVSLFDEGVPFDSSLAPPCPLPTDAEGAGRSAPASGLCLIRNLVDRMEWFNHGRAGKELRLSLYHGAPDLFTQFSAEQLTPFQEDKLPARRQSYHVRRLRPEDAPWVSRLVFRAYGYSYPIEDLYYPDRIESLNLAGKLISAVAVSASDEIVGHCAVRRITPGPNAEIGQAVVDPAHRGRKLLEQMHAFLEREAQREGVVGLAAAPVTSHVFSQKSTESLGSRVSGLLLGLLPQTVIFRRLHDEPLRQRESCLFYFKYLQAPALSEVFAPERHQEFLRTIYGELRIPVAFRPPEPARGVGRLEVHARSALGVGEIIIKQIGEETAAQVRQARRDLLDLAGAAVVYLQLPLHQPGAPELCRRAEDDGFFFSALCPGFAEGGDALRLQVQKARIDLSLLRLASPWAREMAAYVAAERARVERQAPG